jgi:hypothetical protein
MTKEDKKRTLTDEEIDALVIAEADDETAWGEPGGAKCQGRGATPSILRVVADASKSVECEGGQTFDSRDEGPRARGQAFEFSCGARGREGPDGTRGQAFDSQVAAGRIKTHQTAHADV